MYSLLEQHKNGSWWYHPGCTFETEEEVEKCFQDLFSQHPDRPHMAFEHEEPLYQGYPTRTFDFKTFDYLGVIHWPQSLKGLY